MNKSPVANRKVGHMANSTTCQHLTCHSSVLTSTAAVFTSFDEHGLDCYSVKRSNVSAAITVLSARLFLFATLKMLVFQCFFFFLCFCTDIA